MAAWYLVIYTLTMVLVYGALIHTSVINEHDGSLVYRIWGSVIFLFAVSIRFREDFDYLLTLSNTRRDIFLAQLGTALGFSALFSGLMVLERVIVDHLNHVLGYHNITDPLHLFAPYAVNNILLQFVYFLMLCACCFSAGMLLGSLFYQLGKRFTLVFWLFFSAIPTIILPVVLWTQHQRGELTQSLRTLGTYLKTFDVLGASGIILVITVVFSTATWLNIRRLPQK
jgi:hypothetical protein